MKPYYQDDVSDAQLEAMCAQHVAGCVPCDNWKPLMHDSQMRIDDSCGHSNCCPRSMWPPKYMQNPAAVIELLEKENQWNLEHQVDCCYEITIWLWGGGAKSVFAQDQSFAKAGVLALLRARGVEVEG